MKFISGDTFEFSGPVVLKVNGVDTTDLTGWSATSQIRDDKGVLLDDLIVTFVSYNPAVINLSGSQAQCQWPAGMARIDIEFVNPAGKHVSTQTVRFPIEQDVTRQGA